MADKRDYYEVLGVARDVDERTLKSAYRKLAMQFHPDRNPGNGEAETKFKEAAEAYEVLSNAEMRARYDRYGHAGMGGAAQGPGFSGVEDIFSSFGDIFGDLFGNMGGRGRGGGRSRARRGEDLRYDLSIGFREAATGTKHTIEVAQHATCEVCTGTGAKPGTKRVSCATCGGRGEVMHGQGMFIIATTCPTCRGEGSKLDDPCDACTGRGVVAKKNSYNVDIPPGFADGMSLRYTGRGEPGSNGGPPGDLYIVVRVEEDEIFERRDDDLFCEIDLNIAEAALGATVKIPTLEGEDEHEVTPGTQHGDHVVLKKKGIANVQSGRRGNLIAVFRVNVPKELDAEQRGLLESLAKSLGSRPTARRKKGFFGR
jgi:molecular chaperone DnaJ